MLLLKSYHFLCLFYYLTATKKRNCAYNDLYFFIEYTAHQMNYMYLQTSLYDLPRLRFNNDRLTTTSSRAS